MQGPQFIIAVKSTFLKSVKMAVVGLNLVAMVIFDFMSLSDKLVASY